MIVTAFGFIIPILSHFVDEKMVEDAIGVDKSGSVGLGTIMVAPTGGIGGAFIIKRRAEFQYFTDIVCKQTGAKMYEDEKQERLFCPVHGEQKHYVYNSHFTTSKNYNPNEVKDKIKDLESQLKKLKEDK